LFVNQFAFNYIYLQINQFIELSIINQYAQSLFFSLSLLLSSSLFLFFSPLALVNYKKNKALLKYMQTPDSLHVFVEDTHNQ